MEAALRSLVRACRALIYAREKSNPTDFWAAIGRIAQVIKIIDELEVKEQCTH